jgi:gas vesicle protein
MPPKKGTSTPNKPPKNPTWTLDEGEEMRRDINELQNKMDSMESKLESKLDTKMNSMEAKLDTKIDGLKGEIMEVLKNFITEKTPESENASHEIHDEDTRKVIKNGETPNLV